MYLVENVNAACKLLFSLWQRTVELFVAYLLQLMASRSVSLHILYRTERFCTQIMICDLVLWCLCILEWVGIILTELLLYYLFCITVIFCELYTLNIDYTE
jgi:hypothetical protein